MSAESNRPSGFVKFEADSDGRIYGHTTDGEVLPMGIKLKQLAGRSDITSEELKAAAHIDETMDVGRGL
jgi:hypothetical protein